MLLCLALALALVASCKQQTVRAEAPSIAAHARVIDPVVAVTPSSTEVAVGANIVWTYSVSVPTSETQTAVGAVVDLTIPSTQAFVSGTSPKLAGNPTVALDFTNAAGIAQTPVTLGPIAFVRITGATVAMPAPVSGVIANIGVGNLTPGQSATVALTTKAQ